MAVHAEINYVGTENDEDKEKVVIGSYILRKHIMPVESARAPPLESLSPEQSLEAHGFCKVNFRSSVADQILSIQNPAAFRLDKEPLSEHTKRVRDQYQTEVEQLLVKLTGAKHCFTRFHLIRFGKKDTKGAETILNYGNFAHFDYSEQGLEHTTANFLRKRGVSEEELAELDYAYINVWQPLGAPVEQNPLVLLDCSTVDAAGMRHADKGLFPHRKNTGAEHQFTLTTHSSEHRWYYWPQQSPDEILFFYQTDTRKAHRHVFHTSIWDDTAPKNYRRRQNIELKCLCTFPKRKLHPLQGSESSRAARL